MEPNLVLIILLGLLIVGYFLIRRKKNKEDRENRDIITEPDVPEIPDHKPEKPGDVNNGAVFSSFSSTSKNNTVVINKQIVDWKGTVVATMQHNSEITEATLGKMINFEDSLPEPLEKYKFKATVVGDRLSMNSFMTGTLGDLPQWIITLEPNINEIQPNFPTSVRAPMFTKVYLEIEAPEGYLDGVVILELRIETGM